MAMSRSWGRVSGFLERGGGGCGAQTERGEREKVGKSAVSVIQSVKQQNVRCAA